MADLLERQWHAPPAVVQHNLSAIIATVGGGGIFVISFAAYFGRLPTMVYCLIIGFATCIWCAEATSLGSYIAARSINGFFETVAQAVSEISGACEDKLLTESHRAA